MQKQIIFSLLGLFLILMLSSCGFHPRQFEPLPSFMQPLYLDSHLPHGSFTRRLNNYLHLVGIKVAAHPDQATLYLSVLNEKMTTQQTSIGSSQLTQEHIARYFVTYTVKSPKGKTIIAPKTIHTQYQIITLPNEELTSSHKLDEARKTMQEELARQILFHLSTIKKQ